MDALVGCEDGGAFGLAWLQRNLTPLHPPTAQNWEGHDMSPVSVDMRQKHVKSAASQWHSV